MKLNLNKFLGIFMVVIMTTFIFGLYADSVSAEEMNDGEYADSSSSTSIVSILSFDDITAKQALIYPFKDKHIQNLTGVTVAKTEKVDSIGKWNALWDGWVIDAGLAYDSSNLNGGSIMLGRVIGTLGDYFPISFPLKDKLNITVYPIGIFMDDVFDSPKSQLCAGGAFIGASIKF